MASRADVTVEMNNLLAHATSKTARHFTWSPLTALNTLTRREVQVIYGVAYGFTNAEVGRQLGLTEATIKTHLQRIGRKTRTNSRAEVVSWGFRHGLLQRLPVQNPNLGPVFLTNREREMTHWIIRGLTNKAIGATVFLSEDTVKTHLRTLYRKVGARDRAHLITLAWQHRLVPREAFENGAGQK